MKTLKDCISKIVTTDFVHKYISKAYFAKYPGSRSYWERRYQEGRTSGAGSYGRLAKFKANVLEGFIGDNNIESVIEFGCGDGHQLSITNYPRYIGLDVSPTAIQTCIKKFEEDSTKSFFLYDSLSFQDNHGIFNSELGLSLDVIYHLTEDEIFQEYMTHLFHSSEEYVIIYSSNTESDYTQSPDHIQHRRFTDWIDENTEDWELAEKIDNKYPYDPSKPEKTSWADFYIYQNEAV